MDEMEPEELTAEQVYRPQDIVWVKISGMWWVAEVMDQATLDPEVTEGLKKQPLVVVKFLNEDTYEHVRSWDNIFHYNNIKKKEEFLKLGFKKYYKLKNEKNMAKFPEHIQEAERRTGGDPEVVNDPRFLPQEALEQKLENGGRSSLPADFKGKKAKALRRSAPAPSGSGGSYENTEDDISDDERPVITKKGPNWLAYPKFISMAFPVRKPPPDDTSVEQVILKRCCSCPFETPDSGLFWEHHKYKQHNTKITNPRLYRWRNKTELDKKKSGSGVKKTVVRRKKDSVSKPTQKKTKKANKSLPPVPAGDFTPPKKPKMSPPSTPSAHEVSQECAKIIEEWTDDEDDKPRDDTAGEDLLDCNASTMETTTEGAEPRKGLEKQKTSHSAPQKAKKPADPPKPSSSCFDFDEEEPAKPDLQSLGKFGQTRLPRVITPEKSKPPDPLDHASDIDCLLKEVSVPEIPSLPPPKQDSLFSRGDRTYGSSPFKDTKKPSVTSRVESDSNNDVNADVENNKNEEKHFLAKGPLQSKKRKSSGRTEGTEDGSAINKKLKVGTSPKKPSTEKVVPKEEDELSKIAAKTLAAELDKQSLIDTLTYSPKPDDQVLDKTAAELEHFQPDVSLDNASAVDHSPFSLISHQSIPSSIESVSKVVECGDKKPECNQKLQESALAVESDKKDSGKGMNVEKCIPSPQRQWSSRNRSVPLVTSRHVVGQQETSEVVQIDSSSPKSSSRKSKRGKSSALLSDVDHKEEVKSETVVADSPMNVKSSSMAGDRISQQPSELTSAETEQVIFPIESPKAKRHKGRKGRSSSQAGTGYPQDEDSKAEQAQKVDSSTPIDDDLAVKAPKAEEGISRQEGDTFARTDGTRQPTDSIKSSEHKSLEGQAESSPCILEKAELSQIEVIKAEDQEPPLIDLLKQVAEGECDKNPDVGIQETDKLTNQKPTIETQAVGEFVPIESQNAEEIPEMDITVGSALPVRSPPTSRRRRTPGNIQAEPSLCEDPPESPRLSRRSKRFKSSDEKPAQQSLPEDSTPKEDVTQERAESMKSQSSKQAQPTNIIQESDVQKPSRASRKSKRLKSSEGEPVVLPADDSLKVESVSAEVPLAVVERVKSPLREVTVSKASPKIEEPPRSSRRSQRNRSQEVPVSIPLPEECLPNPVEPKIPHEKYKSLKSSATDEASSAQISSQVSLKNGKPPQPSRRSTRLNSQEVPDLMKLPERILPSNDDALKISEVSEFLQPPTTGEASHDYAASVQDSSKVSDSPATASANSMENASAQGVPVSVPLPEDNLPQGATSDLITPAVIESPRTTTKTKTSTHKALESESLPPGGHPKEDLVTQEIREDTEPVSSRKIRTLQDVSLSKSLCAIDTPKADVTASEILQHDLTSTKPPSGSEAVTSKDSLEDVQLVSRDLGLITKVTDKETSSKRTDEASVPKEDKPTVELALSRETSKAFSQQVVDKPTERDSPKASRKKSKWLTQEPPKLMLDVVTPKMDDIQENVTFAASTRESKSKENVRGNTPKIHQEEKSPRAARSKSKEERDKSKLGPREDTPRASRSAPKEDKSKSAPQEDRHRESRSASKEDKRKSKIIIQEDIPRESSSASTEDNDKSKMSTRKDARRESRSASKDDGDKSKTIPKEGTLCESRRALKGDKSKATPRESGSVSKEDRDKSKIGPVEDTPRESRSASKEKIDKSIVAPRESRSALKKDESKSSPQQDTPRANSRRSKRVSTSNEKDRKDKGGERSPFKEKIHRQESKKEKSEVRKSLADKTGTSSDEKGSKRSHSSGQFDVPTDAAVVAADVSLPRLSPKVVAAETTPETVDTHLIPITLAKVDTELETGVILTETSETLPTDDSVSLSAHRPVVFCNEAPQAPGDDRAKVNVELKQELLPSNSEHPLVGAHEKLPEKKSQAEPSCPIKPVEIEPVKDVVESNLGAPVGRGEREDSLPVNEKCDTPVTARANNIDVTEKLSSPKTCKEKVAMDVPLSPPEDEAFKQKSVTKGLLKSSSPIKRTSKWDIETPKVDATIMNTVEMREDVESNPEAVKNVEESPPSSVKPLEITVSDYSKSDIVVDTEFAVSSPKKQMAHSPSKTLSRQDEAASLLEELLGSSPKSSPTSSPKKTKAPSPAKVTHESPRRRKSRTADIKFSLSPSKVLDFGTPAKASDAHALEPIIENPHLSPPKSPKSGVTDILATPARASRWDSPFPMKSSVPSLATSPTSSPGKKVKVEIKTGLGRGCFKSSPPEALEPPKLSPHIERDSSNNQSDDELSALQAEILSYSEMDKAKSAPVPEAKKEVSDLAKELEGLPNSGKPQTTIPAVTSPSKNESLLSPDKLIGSKTSSVNLEAIPLPPEPAPQIKPSGLSEADLLASLGDDTISFPLDEPVTAESIRSLAPEASARNKPSNAPIFITVPCDTKQGSDSAAVKIVGTERQAVGNGLPQFGSGEELLGMGLDINSIPIIMSDDLIQEESSMLTYSEAPAELTSTTAEPVVASDLISSIPLPSVKSSEQPPSKSMDTITPRTSAATSGRVQTASIPSITTSPAHTIALPPDPPASEPSAARELEEEVIETEIVMDDSEIEQLNCQPPPGVSEDLFNEFQQALVKKPWLRPDMLELWTKDRMPKKVYEARKVTQLVISLYDEDHPDFDYYMSLPPCQVGTTNFTPSWATVPGTKLPLDQQPSASTNPPKTPTEPKPTLINSSSVRLISSTTNHASASRQALSVDKSKSIVSVARPEKVEGAVVLADSSTKQIGTQSVTVPVNVSRQSGVSPIKTTAQLTRQNIITLIKKGQSGELDAETTRKLNDLTRNPDFMAKICGQVVANSSSAGVRVQPRNTVPAGKVPIVRTSPASKILTSTSAVVAQPKPVGVSATSTPSQPKPNMLSAATGGAEPLKFTMESKFRNIQISSNSPKFVVACDPVTGIPAVKQHVVVGRNVVSSTNQSANTVGAGPSRAIVNTTQTPGVVSTGVGRSTFPSTTQTFTVVSASPGRSAIPSTTQTFTVVTPGPGRTVPSTTQTFSVLNPVRTTVASKAQTSSTVNSGPGIVKVVTAVSQPRPRIVQRVKTVAQSVVANVVPTARLSQPIRMRKQTLSQGQPRLVQRPTTAKPETITYVTLPNNIVIPAGSDQVVVMSQKKPSSVAPGSDILAKALADTDILPSDSEPFAEESSTDLFSPASVVIAGSLGADQLSTISFDPAETDTVNR